MTKRLLTGILALAMVLSLAVVLAGCGGADVSGHALVGTWVWTLDSNYQYIFNPDGTGTRGGGVNPVEEISWSIPGDGRLTINREGDVPRGEIRREQWNYNIIGDVLTINSRQDPSQSHSYNRVGGNAVADTTEAPPVNGNENDPADYNDANDVNDANDTAPADTGALVGIWAWEDDDYWRYAFVEDGTGTRTRFDRAGTEEFQWRIQGANLHISSADGTTPLSANVVEEIWTMSMAGGVLTLTSAQAADMSYRYVRVEG